MIMLNIKQDNNPAATRFDTYVHRYVADQQFVKILDVIRFEERKVS